MLDKWNKKEKPVFTGITRGVGGFGFGTAAVGEDDAGAQILPLYVDRFGTGLTGTTFNGGSHSGGGWGYGGGNSDAIAFNISGTGTGFRLISISNHKFLNNQNIKTFKIRAETGTQFTNTGSPLYQETKSMQFPGGSGNDTGAFEIPLASPIEMQYNTNYIIGWGYPNGTSSTGNSRSQSGISQYTHNFTDPFGTARSITVMDPNFGGADPFDASNGTSRSGGQLPIIGFEFHS
jgi:hypothetical protein|tara:strand:+ start:689 stop:1390 length:702 start_codon:yes stop_codon:yes gene_type:complete